MAHLKNTITINGKVYDAHTGALVGGQHTQVAVSTTVDGVIRPATRAAQAHKAVPSHSIHGTQRHSQTLKREHLSNPTNGAKTHHVSAAASSATIANHAVHRIPVSPSRLARAKQTKQNKLVSHFGRTQSPVIKRHEAVAVKHSPATPTPADHHKPSLTTHPMRRSDKDVMIDAALRRATSHDQPRAKLTKRRHRVAHKLGLSPRFVSVAATFVALMLVSGFFAFQNMPQLAMKIADSRSGISAKLPGYKPAGYALNGEINYAPGQVSYAYKTRDARSFKVT